MSDEEVRGGFGPHGRDDDESELENLIREEPDVPASMQTHMVAVDQVKRYWRNPRRKQNIEKMVESLTRYGWRQPIVVDAELVIIVGDTRYLGATTKGETHVPVWIARDLTEAQVAAYRIADNRIAEETEWDDEALAEELKLLQSLGVDDLGQATGFDEKQLDKILGEAGDEANRLEPIEVEPFPPYTWVLIGIPTPRYFEIAEHIEAISATDAFCEVTANDEKP